jgi:hypothetical protein
LEAFSVSDMQADIESFRLLAQKRKKGLLPPDEEDEYRRLGQRLAAAKRATKASVQALRGVPLPGCDFFDDYPELYRRGLISNEQEKPQAAGEPQLAGALIARGRAVLADGSSLQGQLLWGPQPSVDGKPFARSVVQVLYLASDDGVIPGPGRLLLTREGRQIKGHLASNLDSEFVDILPLSGAPKGVARMIIRVSYLQKVTSWQPE